MEPNKFMIRMLDRFGLAKWAQPDFEESLNQNYASDGSSRDESSKIFSNIAEEMLHLL